MDRADVSLNLSQPIFDSLLLPYAIPLRDKPAYEEESRTENIHDFADRPLWKRTIDEVVHGPSNAKKQREPELAE
ncbi:MAG: hypothetical protein ACYDC8_13885 [Gammaproteobacteria bacterium]